MMKQDENNFFFDKNCENKISKEKIISEEKNQRTSVSTNETFEFEFCSDDEIDFNLIAGNIRDEAPRFKTLSGDQELININQLISNGTLTIANFELSNIWLNENMVIINCLKNYGGYDYYSQNGAAIAVLDENKEITRIATYLL